MHFDSIYFWSLDKRLSRCWRPVRFRWAASSCLSCQWRDGFQTNLATKNTSYNYISTTILCPQLSTTMPCNSPDRFKMVCLPAIQVVVLSRAIEEATNNPNCLRAFAMVTGSRPRFTVSWAAILSSWTILKCDISPDGPQKRAAPVKVFCSMPPVGSSVVEPRHCGPEQWL